MHVLYFHQHFSTPAGSSGIRSHEMAQALIANGHTVTMVCGSYAQGSTGLDQPFNNGRRRGDVNGIDVIEFDLSYSNHMSNMGRTSIFLKYAMSSIAIALREPYDVVFATTTPLTAGIPGIFARWLRRKPFVFEVRDLWPDLPRALGAITNPVALGLMSILERVSYFSATKLIGLSPGITEGIKARAPKSTPVTTIPNGCDIDIFETPEEPWRPAEISNDSFLAVYTGTHGLANGLGAIIDAAIVLRARGRDNIRILLVGDGKEKQSLKRRAISEGLDNVVFLDPIPKKQLSRLLKSANIGLQVLEDIPEFYFGTSPNKFFDYIAAGLPVLNNYPGWLAGLITDEDCGFVVTPADANAFADALINAADNRCDLIRKGANSSKLANETFCRSDLAAVWVNWVTDVS